MISNSVTNAESCAPFIAHISKMCPSPQTTSLRNVFQFHPELLLPARRSIHARTSCSSRTPSTARALFPASISFPAGHRKYQQHKQKHQPPTVAERVTPACLPKGPTKTDTRSTSHQGAIARKRTRLQEARAKRNLHDPENSYAPAKLLPPQKRRELRPFHCPHQQDVPMIIDT